MGVEDASNFLQKMDCTILRPSVPIYFWAKVSQMIIIWSNLIMLYCRVFVVNNSVLSSLCGQRSCYLACTVVSSLMMVLPVVLAVMAAMIGFDQFFTLFHQVLSVRTILGLFDPAWIRLFLHYQKTTLCMPFFDFLCLIWRNVCVFIYFLGGRNEPIQLIIRP